MTDDTQRPAAASLAFGDIAVGDTFAIERTFSAEDTLAFARVSGDYSPLHVDPAYAAQTEFGGCVVHGMLLASLFSELVGMRIPGVPALYLAQDLTFRRPVLVGEAVRATAKVSSKSDATRTIVLTTEIRGADDKVAVSGAARVKLRDGDTGAPSEAPARTAPVVHGGVALVTGASGGIGGAIARALARQGVAVAVHYRAGADRAATVARDIRAAGGTACVVRADVRDVDAVSAMLSEVRDALGAPTILVNAAIGDLAPRRFDELKWDDFAHHLDTQVKAVVLLCQALYPGMKAVGGGSIVNVLSQVNGGVPPAQMADYVCAKHALEGLSKALAVEWAPDNVRVNMVSPGLTRTELTGFHREQVFKLEAARTPLRRLTTPDDIAAAVAYLAGSEASFITGTNLFVTGGQVM